MIGEAVEYGETLRRWRKERGFKRSVTALAIGVTDTRLGYIERGSRTTIAERRAITQVVSLWTLMEKIKGERKEGER